MNALESLEMQLQYVAQKYGENEPAAQAIRQEIEKLMHNVTEPLPDPLSGKPSFVRAMAAQLADNRPFECFQQWEWEWLRQDLSVAQIEEGLTAAFEYGPNPSRSLVFDILEAARSRVEQGYPPYGNLWEMPSEEENQKYIAASKERVKSYRY